MTKCKHTEGKYHDCEYVDRRNQIISDLMKGWGLVELSETGNNATLDKWHFNAIQEIVEKELLQNK